MKIIGIDVSTWQGEIDWNQVKNSDVKFAILRSSFGSPDPSQVDNQFENNYKGAKAAGIPVGAYHYGYAVSEAEARQEARFFLDTIKGKGATFAESTGAHSSQPTPEQWEEAIAAAEAELAAVKAAK